MPMMRHEPMKQSAQASHYSQGGVGGGGGRMHVNNTDERIEEEDLRAHPASPGALSRRGGRGGGGSRGK